MRVSAVNRLPGNFETKVYYQLIRGWQFSEVAGRMDLTRRNMNRQEADKELIKLKKRPNKNDLKLCPFSQGQCVTGCALWVKYFIVENTHNHQCEIGGGFCTFTLIGG